MRLTLGATAQRRHGLDMMPASLSRLFLCATVREPQGGGGGGQQQMEDERSSHELGGSRSAFKNRLNPNHQTLNPTHTLTPEHGF
jgi:hypothetical protein